MENGNPSVESPVEAAAAPATDDAGADRAAVTDPAELLAAITAERDQLAAEKLDLNDRLLRRQADFENFRRRADREKAEIIEYASMESVRQLLPVLDDFERALGAAPDRDGPAGDYVKGLDLIAQRFAETLRRLGLEPMETVGQPFDPNVHHAVEMVEDEQAADHTVLAEYQRGYTFKGRLLRPAMVRVAVKP